MKPIDCNCPSARKANRSFFRFRIFDIEEQKMVGKFKTLKECVEFLMPKYNEVGQTDDYFVDDVQEDIEVNWDELLDAWKEGERPEDLSMF